MSQDKAAEECCPNMGRSIQDETIIKQSAKIPDTSSYWIRGKYNGVDDGDGRIDDMTPHYEISHCPFCGSKLS